ncbi:NAD(P)H-hydrate dehydratase [Blattabacterium cuenoti]|uniref:NAD(P)H-hydrate dehydratase n=1 Tax=Blattabacterium cuenoti TaxID=1653831 RepID=UPI00163CAAC8|nr:NAD(P)H-hydrate dehydratase [Blattabacterium cuenoti]
MKIFSLNQIKKADQHCIDFEPISNYNLMERASKKCFDWIIKNKKLFENFNFPFIILSGNGNNGGDGLSLARRLYIFGIKVSVYIINISSHYSNEFLINKKKILKYNIRCINIYENDEYPSLCEKSYIIDSIVGVGFNKPLNKYWESFFNFINKKNFLSILSIDVPSGMFIDNNENFDKIIKSNNIIKSDYILTFQVPKLPFFLPDYKKYVKKWYILNIGWKDEFIKKIYTKNFYIDKKVVYHMKKKREKFSHKGNYGNGIIIGGSYGMIGSIVLSGKASFKCGIGKLNIFVPSCGYDIIQNNIFEAIVKTDKNNNYISNINIPENINSIGIGMGMGVNKFTVNAFKSFLIYIKKKKRFIPILIDADAINILSNNLNLLDFLPNKTIITPHPKEFKKLFGSWKNDYHKLYILKKMSKKYNMYIILKGAYSIISTPYDELYFNSTGNPGMATAGSGDVLSGMILSFLSQGYSRKESCIMSVYLHGLAGDIASKEKNECSIIATDIVNYIPKSIKTTF